jgi:hypothetical protein
VIKINGMLLLLRGAAALLLLVACSASDPLINGEQSPSKYWGPGDIDCECA